MGLVSSVKWVLVDASKPNKMKIWNKIAFSVLSFTIQKFNMGKHNWNFQASSSTSSYLWSKLLWLTNDWSSQDMQHLVSLIYSKIHFKKSNDSEQKLHFHALKLLLKGVNLLCWLFRNLRDLWPPWSQARALTLLSPKLLWPHFTGTSLERGASAISRGSQNVSSTHSNYNHVQKSRFLLSGVKNMRGEQPLLQTVENINSSHDSNVETCMA